jgi:hypothetical protein
MQGNKTEVLSNCLPISSGNSYCSLIQGALLAASISKTAKRSEKGIFFFLKKKKSIIYE